MQDGSWSSRRMAFPLISLAIGSNYYSQKNIHRSQLSKAVMIQPIPLQRLPYASSSTPMKSKSSWSCLQQPILRSRSSNAQYQQTTASLCMLLLECNHPSPSPCTTRTTQNLRTTIILALVRLGRVVLLGRFHF